MENILDRIKLYIDSRGVSIRQLERTIGASNGVLSTAIKKGTDIRGKWLAKIIDNDENLNARWLLVGTGTMFSSNVDITDEFHSEDNIKECKKCKEKERIILAQQKTINTQSDYIELLKKSGQDKNENKSKVKNEEAA